MRRTTVVAALVPAVSGVLGLASAYGDGTNGAGGAGWGPMMGGHWGTGWMWLGGIWMVLFWVLVILAIVALVRWLWGRGAAVADQPTALELLKRRYARGEIEREEFEQRRRDLEGS